MYDALERYMRACEVVFNIISAPFKLSKDGTLVYYFLFTFVGVPSLAVSLVLAVFGWLTWWTTVGVIVVNLAVVWYWFIYKK